MFDCLAVVRRSQVALCSHSMVYVLALQLAFSLLIGSRADAQRRPLFKRPQASAESADTSRAARAEAIRTIPFPQLNDEMQRKIRSVVMRPTVFRRLPQQTVECDPRLFLFLIRNPEVVVSIWDLMGATQLSLQRVGQFSYRATDGVGTVSDVQLVYGTKNLHVFYGDGTYEGQLMKNRVRGRCVLVLRSKYDEAEGGGTRVSSVLEMFLQVDNAAVDVLAKTFHQVFGHYADVNFVETVKFCGRLSTNAQQNPEGMQKLANRLHGIEPAVRQQFANLALDVAAMAENRVTMPTTAELPSRKFRTSAREDDSTLRPVNWTRRTTSISRFPADYPRLR